MKTLEYVATCKATYRATIEVPDHYTREQALRYLKDHIGEQEIGRLHYMPNSDVILEEYSGFQRERGITKRWAEKSGPSDDSIPVRPMPDLDSVKIQAEEHYGQYY